MAKETKEELSPSQKFGIKWNEAFNELSLEDQEKFSRALADIVEVNFPHFDYKFRHSGFKGMSDIFTSIYDREYKTAETPLHRLAYLFHLLWENNCDGHYNKENWEEFQRLLQEHLRIKV